MPLMPQNLGMNQLNLKLFIQYLYYAIKFNTQINTRLCTLSKYVNTNN
jgi:hypothetical protein